MIKKSSVPKLHMEYPDEESSLSGVSDMADDNYDGGFLLRAGGLQDAPNDGKKTSRKRRRAEDANDEVYIYFD